MLTRIGPVEIEVPRGSVCRTRSSALPRGQIRAALTRARRIVVTVDHPSEAPAVEFPGPRIVRHQEVEGFTPEVRTKYIDTRLADTRFVLDALTGLTYGSDPGPRLLPAGLPDILDLDHVGAAGHSSGGYAAVEAMHGDRRIDAAVDLDGQIGVDDVFGRAATEGTDRPVDELPRSPGRGPGDIAVTARRGRSPIAQFRVTAVDLVAGHPRCGDTGLERINGRADDRADTTG